jgi:hypothetical protein
MSPKLIAALVDSGIPFCAGIYCTLLGYRIVGKKPGEDAKFDAWYARFGGFMKIGGPFLIVFGIFQFLREIL